MELQRSAISFRRQGSSGLIWDDKFIQAEILNQAKLSEEAKQDQSDPPIGTLQRSRSAGAGAPAYRTVKVSSPVVDPPSPKVSGCGLCGIFGKPVSTRQSKSNRRRS